MRALVVLLLLLPGCADDRGDDAGDGGNVQGTVYWAQTTDPVPDAIITVADRAETDTADADGRFSLELPPGDYTVIAFFENASDRQLVSTGDLDVELRIAYPD